MKPSKLFSILLVFFTISCKETNSNPNLHIVEINKNIDSIVPKTIKKSKLRASKTRLLGKFDYKTDSLFIKVPNKYSSKLIYIQKEVCDSFIKMAELAEKDSIYLVIISGTRSFNEQKRIWERKWNKNISLDSVQNALSILNYSSMPGTSRHHWGTDIDINNLNNSYFTKGKGEKEYDWLIKNAHKFGFFQPYTSKKNGRTGYNEEKWHWSFKPLSEEYLKIYNDSLTYEDINGFLGCEIVRNIDVITNYVNGIEY